LLALPFAAGAVDFSKQKLSFNDVQTISAAIYKIEGGDKTKYPYGVMSINTHGDKDKAKKVCINTINNNFARWIKAGRKNDFLTYLANVYCPPSADKTGNSNWIKNVHKMIKNN